MNECSCPLKKGQGREGQRAKMARQIDKINYQSRQLLLILPSCPKAPHASCHLFHQTFPSYSHRISTHLLDCDGKSPYGPQLFILPHIYTFYPLSMQFFTLKGRAHFTILYLWVWPYDHLILLAKANSKNGSDGRPVPGPSVLLPLP